MRPKRFFSEVKRKFRIKTNKELCNVLGMSHMALRNWQKRAKSLTPQQLANAIFKSRLAAVDESQLRTIQPIVELFPLKQALATRGIRFELINTGKNASATEIALREALAEAHGIYVFYDSRGRALYVGKAKELSLWAEMKNAFNRQREMQTVYRIKHPVRLTKFRPAHEKNRQPRRREVPLSGLAAYVSAFKVDRGMINDLEALLVRGFANDLLNARMERFAHARAASAKRRAARA